MTRSMLVRASTVLGLFAATAVLAETAGCVISLADCPSTLFFGASCGGTGTGVGGTGGTGGTGSTSNTGGGGAGCKDASTCPAVPPGPCATLGVPTCVKDTCGFKYTAGDAPSQVYGNCQKNACDANGHVIVGYDDTNVFQADNECVPYKCTNGVLSTNPVTAAPCALGTSMGVCEPSPDPMLVGLLVCAECDPTVATSCSGVPGTKCVKGKCVPVSCTNLAKDPGESDTDCGGLVCLPCDKGKLCNKASDCFSHVCNGTCQVATCSDNVQNGTETDIDCGGPSCNPCKDTNGCAAPSDCKSGVCQPPSKGQPDVCQPPSCTDGVKNGGETGVDCGGSGDGGPPCPPCP